MGFSGGLTVKNLSAVQETRVQPLGWDDPPGEGNDNPLQYTHLGNPMNREARWATWGCKKSDMT